MHIICLEVKMEEEAESCNITSSWITFIVLCFIIIIMFIGCAY